MLHIMKIHPVGTQLFHAEGRTEDDAILRTRLKKKQRAVFQHSNHRISSHVSITDETNLQLHNSSDLKLTVVGVTDNNLCQHYSMMLFVLLLYLTKLFVRAGSISSSQ